MTTTMTTMTTTMTMTMMTMTKMMTTMMTMTMMMMTMMTMMTMTMMVTDRFSLFGSSDDPVGHNKSQVWVVDGQRVDLFLDGVLERHHHVVRLYGWTDAVEPCCAGLVTKLRALRQQLDGVLDNQL